MSYLKQNLTLLGDDLNLKNEKNVNLWFKNEKIKDSKYLMSNFDTINCSQHDAAHHSYKMGPYVIDRVIGRGNFSVVKLGLHIRTQMQVAIKILNKAKMNTETLEKTYREVKIMKQLRHPNIVRLYQVIESTSWLFIIMEYVSHGELFDYLSQIGRLTENDARNKFQQIVEAVDYCHKMNIVHRDLKSENLLMDGNFNIKLADFGFGSFYSDSYLLSTWCGSPPYAAPELFRGEPYIGPKADIWSLGVVLYAMVCGALPFNEQHNISKLREQVLADWIRFPYFISYDCEDLIRMILNRNPVKRPTIARIKNHKWMQLVSGESLVFSDSMVDSDCLSGSTQSHSFRRCHTNGHDSGFDEPLDFSNANSDKIKLPINHESVCNDVNDKVLQLMERYGYCRTSVIDDLNRDVYGASTATYLLLCAKLRTHHHSYPPLMSNEYQVRTDILRQSIPRNVFGTENPVLPSTEAGTDLQDIDSALTKIIIEDPHNEFPFIRKSPYDNMKTNIDKFNVNFQQTVVDDSLRYRSYEATLPGLKFDRSKYSYNVFNSPKMKTQQFRRNAYNSESSEGYEHSPYFDGTTKPPILNTTIHSVLRSDQQPAIHYTQIKADPGQQAVSIHHQHFHFDGPHAPYTNPLSQMAPICSTAQIPLHRDRNDHSSPFKSIIIKNITLPEVSEMNKDVDFSNANVINKTMKPTSPNFIYPHTMANYVTDSVFEDEKKRFKDARNEQKLPSPYHQCYVLNNDWKVYEMARLSNEDSCIRNYHDMAMLTNRNDGNPIMIRPRLSSGTESLASYTETCTDAWNSHGPLGVSSVSPVKINFNKLS